MRLGFFGDVVGRAGRAAVAEHLPRVRAQLELDFVIVNGENAAGGFGITESTAQEIFQAGADCITLGNHSWDQPEALTYIQREQRLLRPYNYPKTLQIPGTGIAAVHDARRASAFSSCRSTARPSWSRWTIQSRA